MDTNQSNKINGQTEGQYFSQSLIPDEVLKRLIDELKSGVPVNSLDTDHNNLFTYEDAQSLMQQRGITLDPAHDTQAREFFKSKFGNGIPMDTIKSFDSNGDGKIDLGEVKKVIPNIPGL